MKPFTQAVLVLGVLAMTVFIVACSGDNLVGDARARYQAEPSFDNYAHYRMVSSGLRSADEALVMKYVKDSFSECVEDEGMSVSEFYAEKINKKVDVRTDTVIGGVTDCMTNRIEQLQSQDISEAYTRQGFSKASSRRIANFAKDICDSESGCIVGFSEKRAKKNLIGYGSWSVTGDPTGDDRWVMVTYTTDASGWW